MFSRIFFGNLDLLNCVIRHVLISSRVIGLAKRGLYFVVL
jgi:hypothetical protein